MPEPRPALPDFDCYVTVGQVITELFELKVLHMDDCVDRDTARLLAKRLNELAPERQLTLALTA